MNEKQIINFGRLFKLLRMDAASKLYTPKDNIRISLSHYVRPCDMDNFESLIVYLKSTRKIITPDEFFQYYKTPSINSFKSERLLVTFDDGLYSSYQAAQKVLSKYDIKAIFFIPTKIFELESKEEMLKFAYENLYRKKQPMSSLEEYQYLTMTKDNVVALKEQGHWVLPHTHSHCQISQIGDEILVNHELVKPKLILEELLQEEIKAFAFPEGTERSVNGFSYQHIKSIYKFCFSSLAGVNHIKTDPYYLRRDCIHAHYPLFHVKNVMEGVFDSYYWMKLKKMQFKTEVESLC